MNKKIDASQKAEMRALKRENKALIAEKRAIQKTDALVIKELRSEIARLKANNSAVAIRITQDELPKAKDPNP